MAEMSRMATGVKALSIWMKDTLRLSRLVMTISSCQCTQRAAVEEEDLREVSSVAKDERAGKEDTDGHDGFEV
jgi:hypothetical protein